MSIFHYFEVQASPICLQSRYGVEPVYCFLVGTVTKSLDSKDMSMYLKLKEPCYVMVFGEKLKGQHHHGLFSPKAFT